MRPSAGAPTGTVIGPAGVDDFHAAHDGVGRRHRDGAHLVAADVLLHLDRHLDRRAVRRGPGDLERVVELRQMLGLELDVEHGADDLNDLADIVNCRRSCHDYPWSAAAPPTISAISCVMVA